MKNVNKEAVSQSNVDFATSYEWHVHIVNFPSSVYNPGEDFINSRLLSVTPPTHPRAAVKELDIRGFKVLNYDVITRDGEVTLELQDREDMVLTHMVEDWLAKISDPQTNRTNKKADLIIDLDIYQLSKDLKPIHKWECRTGLMDENTVAEKMDAARDINGKITMKFKFELVIPSVVTAGTNIVTSSL